MDCHILPPPFFFGPGDLMPIKTMFQRERRHICSSIYFQYSGIEPESPALAGRFFTTEPPGMPIKKQYTDIKLFSNTLKV